MLLNRIRQLWWPFFLFGMFNEDDKFFSQENADSIFIDWSRANKIEWKSDRLLQWRSVAQGAKNVFQDHRPRNPYSRHKEKRSPIID